jgi:hypothetical protein
MLETTTPSPRSKQTGTKNTFDKRENQLFPLLSIQSLSISKKLNSQAAEGKPLIVASSGRWLCIPGSGKGNNSAGSFGFDT